MVKKIILLIIAIIFLFSSGISLYFWSKPVESLGYKYFKEGNNLVLQGDKEKNPEKKMEDYKKALTIYKTSMKESSDINIKKNYEITERKIKEQNKQKQNQNKNQQNKQKQNKNEKNKSNQKQNEKQENQQQNKQENRKEQELKAILKRLEGNEKETFKNNEKMVNLKNNSNTSENRW